VAAIFWLAFVWGAIKVLSAPDTGKHSHLAGWVILVVATSVMITTMNHWVKYLQVVFGGAILGGFLATASGHLLNGVSVPRTVTAAVTALLIACGLVSRTIAKRKLRLFDRVALVAFLAAFVVGWVKDTPTSYLGGLGIGFGFLLAAWARERLTPAPPTQLNGATRGSS
jgi:hypothetical protein